MLIAGVALAFGSVFAASSPASAHLASPTAAFHCGATRPTGSHILLHATPDVLHPAYVRYYCRSTNGSFTYQWWIIVWWNGEVTFASGYQDCSVVNCSEPN